MKSVKQQIRWPAWVLSVVVIALLGSWVVQAIMSTPTEEEVNNMTKTQNTPLNVQPQRITTSDEYSRYIQNITQANVTKVMSQNIYYPKDIDWSEDVVIAIVFPLASSKAVTGASREVVDGTESYVIDVLDPPSCGVSTQDNTMRAVLIAQSMDDTTAPVILRASPNTATCEGM